MKREDVCDAAKKITTQNRHEDYGDAKENFNRIASGWDVIVKVAIESHGKITAAHVALMMDWVKTSRLLNKISHTDSWIDKCGYSAIGAEFEDERDILREDQALQKLIKSHGKAK
tara:strand:- start:11380 stop:11724 length:345 start_codon:yes stop_codon:yes gene_type:complete